MTKNGTSGDPLAPMVMDQMVPLVHPIAVALEPMTITIGANIDHHMVPFKWLYWRHFVAMWRLQYTMKIDGTNGDQSNETQISNETKI